MWLLFFFVRELAAVTLKYRIVLLAKSRRNSKEGMPTSYSGKINYLLETYAAGDAIAYVDAQILSFTRRSNMMLTGHTEVLWKKSFRCELV